jgi:MSHA biogenesis protein MshK
MRNRATLLTIATATLLAMAGARAQALTDPTRPPAATAGAPASGEEASGAQLQSILLSSRRKIAVINGNMIPLGGMVGEAKVVKISETEVVLKKGDETEVLKLFPAVDKQPSRGRNARAGTGGSGPVSTRQGGTK